jgi:allophanate hydrolase subunit 1
MSELKTLKEIREATIDILKLKEEARAETIREVREIINNMKSLDIIYQYTDKGSRLDAIKKAIKEKLEEMGK